MQKKKKKTEKHPVRPQPWLTIQKHTQQTATMDGGFS